MQQPLPDNALLEWLQDPANNEFRTLDTLTAMYNFFTHDKPNPVDNLQMDRHHCYLVYSRDTDTGISKCSVLHHLAQYPARMGNATPYNGNWYIAGGQPVGGNQITYELPGDLF